jgi:programmed cell death protein 5
MSSDEGLERIRAQRLAELQAKQRQQEEIQRAQEEVDAQKQALIKRILTPEARQRLTNIRMIRPDFVNQIELQLIQLSQTGRLQIPVTDTMLKNLLSQLQKGQRREINIRRI